MQVSWISMFVAWANYGFCGYTERKKEINMRVVCDRNKWKWLCKSKLVETKTNKNVKSDKNESKYLNIVKGEKGVGP